MKNKTLFLLSIISLLIIQSCSNDFVLIDKWKNIPIVYGIINIKDSIHYVRIEKAFIDPEVGADKLARISDSLYYDNIRVVFTKVGDSKEYELSKIDGETVNIPKNEGAFANQPNILYRIDANDIQLGANDEITLKIYDNAADSLLTQATANIVGDYNFALNYPGDPISFAEDRKTSISWRPKNGDVSSKFASVKFVFHVLEETEVGSNKYIEKELIWDFEDNFQKKVNGYPILKVEGNSFFNFLKDHLDNSLRIKRKFPTIDLIVNHGGGELFNYINIGQANTGITSSQTIPTYTNLSKGKGIFSSRIQMEKTGMALSKGTKDALMESNLTKDLNFE